MEKTILNNNVNYICLIPGLLSARPARVPAAGAEPNSTANTTKVSAFTTTTELHNTARLSTTTRLSTATELSTTTTAAAARSLPTTAAAACWLFHRAAAASTSTAATSKLPTNPAAAADKLPAATCLQLSIPADRRPSSAAACSSARHNNRQDLLGKFAFFIIHFTKRWRGTTSPPWSS